MMSSLMRNKTGAILVALQIAVTMASVAWRSSLASLPSSSIAVMSSFMRFSSLAV